MGLAECVKKQTKTFLMVFLMVGDEKPHRKASIHAAYSLLFDSCQRTIYRAGRIAGAPKARAAFAPKLLLNK